jgi:hypothetical protein
MSLTSIPPHVLDYLAQYISHPRDYVRFRRTCQYTYESISARVTVSARTLGIVKMDNWSSKRKRDEEFVSNWCNPEFVRLEAQLNDETVNIFTQPFFSKFRILEDFLDRFSAEDMRTRLSLRTTVRLINLALFNGSLTLVKKIAEYYPLNSLSRDHVQPFLLRWKSFSILAEAGMDMRPYVTEIVYEILLKSPQVTVIPPGSPAPDWFYILQYLNEQELILTHKDPLSAAIVKALTQPSSNWILHPEMCVIVSWLPEEVLLDAIESAATNSCVAAFEYLPLAEIDTEIADSFLGLSLQSPCPIFIRLMVEKFGANVNHLWTPSGSNIARTSIKYAIDHAHHVIPTLLQLGAVCDHSLLVDVIAKSFEQYSPLKYCEEMVASGFDLSTVNRNGWSVLHLYIKHLTKRIPRSDPELHWFFRNGADPNQPGGKKRQTPLMLVFSGSQAFPDSERRAVVARLMYEGGDPYICDSSKKNAFDYAEKYFDHDWSRDMGTHLRI